MPAFQANVEPPGPFFDRELLKLPRHRSPVSVANGDVHPIDDRDAAIADASEVTPIEQEGHWPGAQLTRLPRRFVAPIQMLMSRRLRHRSNLCSQGKPRPSRRRIVRALDGHVKTKRDDRSFRNRVAGPSAPP